MNKLTFEGNVVRLNGNQIAIQQINTTFIGMMVASLSSRELPIVVTDQPFSKGAWGEQHRVRMLETSGDTIAQFMTYGRISGGLSNSAVIPKIAAALRIPVPYLPALPDISEDALVLWLNYDNNQPTYYLVYIE